MEISGLPTEEAVKQKFLEYFASGKSVIQSRRHHQNRLRSLENFSEALLAHRRLNPTQRVVRDWYLEWKTIPTDFEVPPPHEQPSRTSWSAQDHEALLLRIAEMFLQCDRFITSSAILRSRLENSGVLITRIRIQRVAKKAICKNKKSLDFIPKYKLIKRKETK